MAFRNDEIITIRNIVICDKCRKEKLIKETKNAPLNFENRLNDTLAQGFTFKNENGVFKNYCPECAKL